jgi:PAS domain S-box-containing protein
MILKQAAKLIALVSLTVSYWVVFAAGDEGMSRTQAVQQAVAPTRAATTNRVQGDPLDQIPISRISSLTRELAQARANPLVRIQGVVLDQGLGEYVVIQDESGSIRADTHETTPIGGGERAVAWGRLSWDGNQLFLRNTSVRPLAWDSIAEQRIEPAPGRPDHLPTLTQVRQIRDLPPSEAAWKYPVRVRGVVTTLWKDYQSLFVQDETAGIFIAASKLNLDTNWNVGDEVEIEGVSGPGGYAPIIEADIGKILGRKQLPAARLVTLYQMAMGQFDGQWVEVRGVVRSVRINRRSTDLEVSDINGLVEVDVPGGEAFTNLVDSLVRVRGVCGSRANPNRQLTGAYVWSPSTNLLIIVEKGVADPFTLPTQPIASLSQFTQPGAIRHRVKIAGVVTFSQPGRPLFVQDETGGVPIYTAQAADFKPGDRVEVAGYLSPGDFGYVFRNASCRITGRASIPAAKPVSIVNTLNQNLHGVWVQVRARLVSWSRRGNEDVLTLQADNSIFEAIHPSGDDSAENSSAPAGSLVQLEGVYSILGDESRMPRALRLYVPSSESIQIVEKPSWWNARHASTAVGIMLAVVVAGALWTITLRRRIREQTLVIRERLSKETALEQQYREIFDSANDLILTFDLEGRLTSLNPAGQRALGYNPGEIKQLAITQILAPGSRGLERRLLETKPTNGHAATFECEFVAKDGRLVLVETSARVMLKDGKVHSVQAISRDIAERKRAEAAVAEASSLLQTLLDHSPDCIYFKDAQSRFVRYSKAFEKLFKVAASATLRGKTDFDFFTEEHARPAFEDEQEIVRTGKPIIGKLERETHADGRVTWALTTKMPWHDKEGQIIGTFGISKDVTAIKETEGKLAYERELFRTLLETLPDAIYFKDRDSRFVRLSRSKGEMTLQLVRHRLLANPALEAPKELPAHLSSGEAFAGYLIGKTDFDSFDDKFARAAFEEEQEILRTGQPVIGKLEHFANENRWMLVTKMPWRDTEGNIIGTFGVSRDITALKEAEVKLEAVHRRLLETSRQAGMAEVATDVLHNVGNVLNSVNVSCSLALDRIKSSKVASLSKVSSLLQENRGQLGQFFTQDPRAQQIPEFLVALSEHLGSEQTSLLKELEQLVNHIDHIKQIVAMQQTYAKVVGVVEIVSPAQLVEDALHINAAALLRHNVHVRREFEKTPDILTEKHKVLQILVNLIRNAKYATDEAKRADKLMTVRIANNGNSQIRIEVIDNGVGIPKENLTRIFSHGFTTRRNGHGFGLHSSALAVRDLGGSLQAHSDGPGKGASFTLLLPSAPPNQPQQSV